MSLFLRLAVVGLIAFPASAAEPDFSADRVKAHVGFFADDLLEGRGTGTRGHEIAARYAAAVMAGYGVLPGARGNSWFQPVSLAETRLTSGAITITGKAGTSRHSHASDVMVSPSQFDATTDVTAPVVFAGFGLDAPAQSFNDYAGLDVRGKIVVVFGGIPKGPPDEVVAHLGTQKAKMAAARGAIGIVQIPTLDGDKRRPWERQLQYAAEPRLTWTRADGTPNDPAPGIKAGGSLNMAAAQTLFAGSKVPLAKLLAAADKMGGKPKGFALPATLRIEAASTMGRVGKHRSRRADPRQRPGAEERICRPDGPSRSPRHQARQGWRQYLQWRAR